jgi:hypothetical protein
LRRFTIVIGGLMNIVTKLVSADLEICMIEKIVVLGPASNSERGGRNERREQQNAGRHAWQKSLYSHFDGIQGQRAFFSIKFL